MTMLRSFDEELHLRDDGDVCVIEGRIVPYDEVATVVDHTPDGPVRYREGFLPGSCTRMAQAVRQRGNAAFIRLNLEHGQTFDARIGHGMTLEERDDGCHARFRLYDGPQLAKLRSMIDTSHRGFSLEFDDVAKPVERDGVVWRRQVRIDAVAVTPMPAYAGAFVRDDGTDDLGGTPALDEVLAFLRTLKGETLS